MCQNLRLTRTDLESDTETVVAEVGRKRVNGEDPGVPVMVHVGADDGDQTEQQGRGGGVDDGVQRLDARGEVLHAAEVLHDTNASAALVFVGTTALKRRPEVMY